MKKCLVYISISDKMLFQSGSAMINPKAEVILEKVSRVVNDFTTGHTGQKVVLKLVRLP